MLETTSGAGSSTAIGGSSSMSGSLRVRPVSELLLLEPSLKLAIEDVSERYDSRSDVEEEASHPRRADRSSAAR